MNIKALIGILLFCVSMSISSQCLSGWYQGTVTRVFPVNHAGGRVYVQVENGNGDSVCATSDAYWIDPATAIGKSFLSVALTAKATGKLVWVGGDSTCHLGWPMDGAEKMTMIDLKG